jgi:Protein of unknown function (DUF3800)
VLAKYTRDVKATTTRIELLRDHKTAAAFIDETGAIAQDRFFAVGCLILPEPSIVLRKLQKLRDTRQWHSEIKWVDLTMTSLPLYVDLVDLMVGEEARFSCFIADRTNADPVKRFKQDAWLAYEKLATQVILGAAKPYELLSVMADNYSTPDHVRFEEELRSEVNRRLDRLAVTTVCRLDSKSCDALQIVDVLTGAVTFEHRHAAGLAGNRSAKYVLAEHLRNTYGVSTTLAGCKTEKLNVALYRNPSRKVKLFRRGRT